MYNEHMVSQKLFSISKKTNTKKVKKRYKYPDSAAKVKRISVGSDELNTTVDTKGCEVPFTSVS